MMKATIIFGILLMFSTITWANLKGDVEKVDGGIGIHVSNDLFNALKIDILEKGFELLKILDIPDVPLEKNLLGLIALKGDISNIKIVDIGWDFENTKLRFSDAYPNILIQLIDFYVQIEFDYSLLTMPEIYRDIGKAIINVAPFKISMGMSTQVNNGVLSADIESFSYYFDDYTIDFTGNGDVSFLLVSIAESLKPIFQADLSPNIEGLLDGIVMPQINDLLASLGSTADLGDFTFDYSIMGDTLYTKDDFSIVLKGEVRPTGGQPPPFEKDWQVPKYLDPSRGYLQAFISDYVIRSLLYSVYQTEILAIKYDDNPLSGGKLNVGLMKYLIIDLKKKYSDDTVVYFEINTIDTSIPEFYITGGETYLTLQLNIIIGVTPSEGTDVKIASMRAQTDMTLNYGLEDGTKIAASISSFWLNLVGKVTNYDPVINVDTDDFNATLGLVPGIVRNYVNYALDALDIPLPEIPLINLDLNKTYILEKEGYLVFETSPRITFKNAKEVQRSPPLFNREKSFRKQLTTREAKVEFVKRLVKATPLMKVLDEAKRQKNTNRLSPDIFGVSYRKSSEDSIHDCDTEALSTHVKEHTS